MQVRGDLRNAESVAFFKFNVKFPPGFEKSIKVSLIPEQGNWHKAYVKVGHPPLLEKDFKWESWGG
jgi:hypothetical protein